MKNKIMISLIAIFLMIGFIFLGKNLTKEKQNDEDNNTNIKETNNYLISTVLAINDNYITIQDEKNIIYTFFMNNVKELYVGENIEIEYKGELIKNKKLQENEVINYKILKSVNGELPNVYNDNGLFSNFYSLAYNKLSDMTLLEKIGQILLVRVPEKKQIEDLRKYKFGGYLLFERDFKGKMKLEVINTIKSYQDNSDIPLLIAVDEEGGKVSRISSNSNLVDTPFKSPKELYDEGGFDLIRQDTINKSKILDELGINLNLAPVVDVSTNSTDYIYGRTIGENTNITSQYAKTVIEASHLSNVSYTLKHFPGYGNNLDTHLGISVDTRSIESIEINDLPPFKSGIDAKAEAVLVSHNIVKAIDSNMPASLSQNVHNLLRDEMNFTGIIITDDLSMNAISNNYPDTAVIDAILSGNDLLIVTDYKKTINEIQEALKNGILSEEIISKMAFRILSWKYYKGLIVENQK